MVFDVDITKTIKTLIIKDNKEKLLALVLRGDHELNEIKVEKLPQISAPFSFASSDEVIAALSASIGSLGPIGAKLPVIVDYSAAMLSGFACGANEDGFHYVNASWEEVENFEIADIRNVVVGDLSPDGKGVLQQASGIEVGHIFSFR